MRRLNVDMQDLIAAMVMSDDLPFRSFLDLREDTIVQVPTEHEEAFGGEGLGFGPDVEADPDRYVEVGRVDTRRYLEVLWPLRSLGGSSWTENGCGSGMMLPSLNHEDHHRCRRSDRDPETAASGAWTDRWAATGRPSR